ncbi:hypothetical protein E2C01_042373 [Portunus trituberculatus]|uniref:Uncharacterized protein n=1 Tax=Portunus trituberculatus TaxID=210409 RepID=A0A5B7FSW9_PORTR|nr:hypothetical protein [Portunus trituberculatus]
MPGSSPTHPLPPSTCGRLCVCVVVVLWVAFLPQSGFSCSGERSAHLTPLTEPQRILLSTVIRVPRSQESQEVYLFLSV